MNRIIRLCALIVCITLLTVPFSLYAAEKFNMDLTYSKDKVVFSGLDINIYRIADINCDKITPYDTYPVEVKGITTQSGWSEAADTLYNYIQADSIKPYMTQKTDEKGKVSFSNIDSGLYLVSEVSVEKDGHKYTFYDFMILVTEDVSANPKGSITLPDSGEKTYTVLKLWKDDGSKKRPTYITVDILKDGKVYQTINLDHVNNWSYTFKTDLDGTWSVVERNVPKNYSVVVTKKDTSFIITNTYSGTETTTRPGTTPPGNNAPQTGDTFPMKRYMVMLCVSGMMLVVLGFGMRSKDDAKSR